MISTRLNSLVFVGGEFAASMFDERLLFSGNLDPDQFKAGGFGNFSYSSGTCQLAVTPNRVDLRCTDPAIMPETLVESGKIVVDMLMHVEKLAHVSGFGINCDTVFNRDSIGISGREFCMKLIDSSIENLIDVTPAEAFTRIRFTKNGIHYNMRIEPHTETDGQHLFVGINAHQPVESLERLILKLDEIEGFRSYVGELHGRIGGGNDNV